MLSLKIDNSDIEKIFLHDFNSDKERFFEFIVQSYNKNKMLEGFKKSLNQAKLQDNGELENILLEDLIDELENSSNT